ncbi:MAG: prepilin-type N-terminal cleavage/methylation domain-containing protein, partial [Phycisphaerae bacterium]
TECFNRASGFTLVEATAAIAVLAVAATAIVMPFTTGAAHEREQARSTVAMCIAGELMEHIVSLPFEKATGETIMDYDGYSEPIEPIQADDGTVLDDPAAAGMTRSATCEYVYVPGQDTSEPPSFIRVTVQVSYRGITIVNISRLVYRD